MGEVLDYVRRVLDAATMGTSDAEQPLVELRPPAVETEARQSLVQKVASYISGSGGVGSM